MNIFGEIGMVFLIVINIVFILLGLGLVIIGGMLYEKSFAVDEYFLELMDNIDIGTSFTLGKLLKAVSILIFIIGVFAFVVSATGAFGACCKNRVLLVIYGIIVVIMAIVEIFVAKACYDIIQKVNDTFKNALLDLLSTYAGNTDDVLTVAWNIVFLLADCCGVNAQSTTDDFASTTWAGTRGSDVIPGHCCADARADTASNYYGATCSTSPSSATSSYDTGCYTVIENALLSYSKAIVSVCSLIVIAEIVIIVAVVIMFIEITKDVNSKKTSPGVIFQATDQSNPV